MIEIPKDIDWKDYIELCGSLEASDVHSAAYWRDDMIDLSRNGTSSWGDALPWGKCEDFKLRPSEITLWCSMNGHRKSMILGQIMLGISKHSRIAICSLEMTPAQTLMRMAKQACGASVGEMSEEFIHEFADYADDNVLVFDALDTIDPTRVLGFTHYAAKVLGCKHIVIDSLTKVGLRHDDTNAEKDFMNRLQHSAKTLGVHIHLVCHVRKPQSGDESWIPSKFDVRGASSIVDLADNLVIVWKNKKREMLKEISKDHELDEKQLEYLSKSFDQKLIVEKQRHSAWEGTFNFYFHNNSLQLTSQEDKPVKFYFPKVVDTNTLEEETVDSYTGNQTHQGDMVCRQLENG